MITLFGGGYMETILMIISPLLIILILLQSGKVAESGNIIQGGNSELFQNRKERGGELFLTRVTAVLGTAFFMICLIMSF